MIDVGDIMQKVIPNHVAIILDGNGRWAAKRGLPRSAGHLQGSKTLKTLVKHIFKKGVKVFSVFAFSTENFNRDYVEVDYLMSLFLSTFKKEFNDLAKENIKIVFSGSCANLSPEIITAMVRLEESSKNNEYIFNICLNYGGRLEIVDAVKKIIDKKVSAKEITVDSFKKYLYNDLPDIDLMIRTGGNKRISNFMLYLLSYAELYFTDIYFPDFKVAELDKALTYFNTCERRFGGNSKK